MRNFNLLPDSVAGLQSTVKKTAEFHFLEFCRLTFSAVFYVKTIKHVRDNDEFGMMNVDVS